jgi:hypothetical protein
MFASTTGRVANNTGAAINRRFEGQAADRVKQCARAGPDAIERRLAKLDREWDIERLIEVEAPATIMLGILLANLHDRRWMMLSAFAASMVIVHSLQGWYPLLPVLRRLGVRSQAEIEMERNALRALRGEHAAGQAGQALH